MGVRNIPASGVSRWAMPIADILASLQGFGILNNSQQYFALQGHIMSAQGIALRRQDRFRTHKV